MNKDIASDIAFFLAKKSTEQFAKAYYNNIKKNALKKREFSKPVKENFDNVLYINTLAGHGGAARCAYDNLCKSFRLRKNLNTFMLAKALSPNISNETVGLAPRNISEQQDLLNYMQIKLGWQYFFQLGSFEIKDHEFFKQADILHFHNLHGGYFSPFVLPELTALKPTLWTLHDEQSFTGHCAYSFDCEQWQSGCRDCPDLSYYPTIEAKATDFVLKTKKHLYDNSLITYVCPSNWLKTRAQKSILQNKDIRVIYNGVDEKVFYNFEKEQARKELGLPVDKKILMFTADGSTDNPQKGGIFIKNTYERMKNRDDLLFLAIGGGSSKEHNLQNISYIYDETMLAKYYAASDLFIFPTLADNLPYVVLESMSCGTPVISFDVGGVPEEIQHLETGYVAKYKDLNDFIKGINIFLENDELRKNASIKARETIEKAFTIDISLENYLKLYNEIWENAKK